MNIEDQDVVVAILPELSKTVEIWLTFGMEGTRNWLIGGDRSIDKFLIGSPNSHPTSPSDMAESRIYMAIDNSGQVGIGTTTPGYKLHVVGTIYGKQETSKQILRASWVFDVCLQVYNKIGTTNESNS